MNVRHTGVRIPENQSTEQAPTMTVTRCSELKVALVEYGDERGIKHTTVAFIAGDRAYIPPQGDQWTMGFRAFVKEISDQILDHLDRTRTRPQDVPTKDAVDVTGSAGLTGDSLVPPAQG